MNYNDVLSHVCALISEISEQPGDSIGEDTELIGSRATVKSRELVEIMLALEEFAEDELGTEFDWTSDSALSLSKSIFRTAGTLAHHLDNLQ